MTSNVVSLEPALALDVFIPPERHPAKVYIARLAPGSRRTMRQALDVVASLLSSGGCDAETLNWSVIRYQHTAAIRSALAEPMLSSGNNQIGIKSRTR